MIAIPASPLAGRLLGAAAALTANPPLHGTSPDASALLQYLSYGIGDAALNAKRASLLRAAARLRALFILPVPDAPGLVFFGGEADPACLGAHNAGLQVGSLAGSGVMPQRAFEACVGEGIEYLSQFSQASDIIETGTLAERCGPSHDHQWRFLADVLSAGGVDPAASIGWVRARSLPAGPDAWFPADLCLRRPMAQRSFVAPFKLSTGCAAGATLEDAALRALLELIERDAAALWWRGGQRGRAIAPESEAGRAGLAMLDDLRQGNQKRRSWLLDITTDVEVPAIAAISSREDGYGFAFGLAARMNAADAARAAIFEMCQSELAHHVVAAKRHEAGDAALNQSDVRRLQHGALIDTRQCAQLQPSGESRLASADAAVDPTTALRVVLTRLAAQGITAFLLDLTRPDFAVPVVRVLAPGLQVEPCPVVSERLARMLKQTANDRVHATDLPLL